MGLVQHDEVVLKLPAKRTDEPLRVRVGASCQMHRRGAVHLDVFG
jgi:hypothetical protein